VTRFWVVASGAKKLCALGAMPALLGGPSTSPLAFVLLLSARLDAYA
jgi:hypothetical protein